MLSGDDAMTLPVISLGGRGVISVASNQIPGAMTELARLANEGDFAAARKLQRQWFSLMQVNFVEANPGPVKWGMHIMGLSKRLIACRWLNRPPPASRRSSRFSISSGLLATAGAH